MWLNVLRRRWFGRSRPCSSHLSRRRSTRRPCIGPRLEVLEDRTLLSAPGDVLLGGSGNVSVSPTNQPDQVSGSYFLGGSFTNVGGSVGGVAGSDPTAFGAELNLNVSGKAGIDLGYSASSGGQVNASYKGVNLQQNYLEPTQFGQEVNFTPQNTNVAYTSGLFSTTGPSASVSASLDASISGSVGGTIAFFKSYSGSTKFNYSVDQPLVSIGIGSDTQSNDLGLMVGVLGQDISSQLSQLVQDGHLSLSVTPFGPEIPVIVEGDISGASDPFSLHESLSAGVGEGEGEEAVGGLKELGSMDEFVPDLSLNSNSLQNGGVLTASGQGSIADLNIQAGDLLGPLSTDTFSIGPASVSITPLSFQIGPDLTLAQTGTVTPLNQLTYSFADASGHAMQVDVTKDGQDLGMVSSVSFAPGIDNIGIKFTGTPITVTPTWNFGLNYTSQLDLDVNLQGTLTAGEASVGYGPVSSPPLGPVYQQTFNLANAKVATLYEGTNSIYSSSQTLSSFVIGSTFNPSLDVTEMNDSDAPGSLRAAVETADLPQNNTSNSPSQIIHLGPGTYYLTIGPNSSGQGTSGGLYVTAQNLTIEGAGSGQTFIYAAGLGDRAFDVGAEANLTLEGLSVVGGAAAPNATGGAILNSGTVTLRNSSLLDNSALEGGAIENAGTLTIDDSTLTNNTSSGAGGAIENGYGTELTIDDSTISGNTAGGFGGGISNDGLLTLSDSTISGNKTAYLGGGGVFNSQNGTATIDNSTISGNSAVSAFGIPISGGGVYNSSVLTLLNSTISNNTVSGNGFTSGTGGGLGTAPSSFRPNTVTTLYNTLVAGNFEANNISSDISGVVAAASANNLIGDGNGASGIANGSNGNMVGQQNALLDPKLAPLGNYGGPTQTMALLPGSLAIEAGTSNVPGGLPLTDQRGFPRNINGKVDIGAVEYQYDLDLTGSIAPGATPGTIQYSYTATNNGPDPVAGTTLTVPLPLGTSFLSQTLPTGWTEIDPGADNNGTVTFTDTGDLNSGQSANFTVTVQLQNTTTGAILANTATVGPTASDPVLSNNSLTLAIDNEQEGQTFNKVLLYHFTDANANATANAFTAFVGWGDNSGNTSIDGTGNVTVVSDPNGGFDVLGAHAYAEEGSYGVSVVVTGLDGTEYNNGSTLNTVNQPLANALLYHFTYANIPVVNTPTGSNSGGTLAANTYYYTVTSTTAMGESPSSNEVSATTTGNNSEVTLTWNQAAGATGYKVYRGTSPGAENTLIATLAGGSTVSFADNGSETTTLASPPTISVAWGDNTTNSSADGSGSVFVVADPNGGFDVLGSHNYAQAGSYGIAVAVTNSVGTQVNGGLAYNSSLTPHQLFIVADAPLTAGALTPPPNATINQAITKAVLFHFTDADPKGTASDYTATVTWGDGKTNSSGDSSGTVSVVADSAGGFDVLGSHTYTQLVNPGTFSVQVSDAGGSSTSASDSNFQVLYPDQPLTAGALNVPAVTTEGQSVSGQVLFHFSDADPDAKASDYLAVVTWGDGTFNSSNDSSKSVSVVANSNGGFDVVGSHVYGEGSGNYFAVKVTDLGDLTSTQPDSGGQFTGAVSSTPLTITDPAVVATAGQTFTANPGTLSNVQTVATFTDPGGPETTEPNGTAPYIATIQWGDGSITAATLTTQANYTQASANSQGQITGQLVSAENVGGIVLDGDGQTFSINLAHQYATAGTYTITTTIHHEDTTSTAVTSQAVAGDLVTATGGFSIQGTAGISTGNKTLATFTDPDGAKPVADYSASINWGDDTASQPDISSGVISFDAATQVFTVSAAHTYANVGTYPITVILETMNAFPVTVSSSATITPATPTLMVSDAGGVYNGSSFPATATAVGVDGKTAVAGSFSFAYSTSSGTPLSSAPVNAGAYTVVATFTSNDPNYTKGTAQAAFTIANATSAFTNLTVQQILLGTSTTTVSGLLASNTVIPVGQSVSIALNGVTESATVGADGSFSVSFATGTLGVGKFAITYSYAGDANFAAASGTGSLTVAYGSKLLFNNNRPIHAGHHLHIRLELTNANGTDVSSSNIAVTAVSLVGPDGNPVPLKSGGHSNPNNLFRYEHGHRLFGHSWWHSEDDRDGKDHHGCDDGSYVFDLDTKGLAAGTYTLYYKAGNDPTLHSLTFVIGNKHDLSH